MRAKKMQETERPEPMVGRPREKQPGGRGCITSTPNPANFSIFWQKRAKNERGFCIPGPKIAERPYLAS